MARTINEIKKTMTDAFMADATIRDKYGLSEGDTFSGKFSTVSIENILFYIVAACCHVLEVFFDAFKKDVDDKISRAVVAGVPWYHKKALQFQYGHSLVYDEATCAFGYAVPDESSQVVKYAAVRDKGTHVEVLVSGENNGSPEPLATDVLTSFENYMKRIKIAGVVLVVKSLPADSIKVRVKIYTDPLTMDKQGKRIEDGSEPVKDAVTNYLKGILYGGTFNKTKLVDAIQVVDGVSDVELGRCEYKSGGETSWMEITGNSHTAIGGCFVLADGENESEFEYVQVV